MIGYLNLHILKTFLKCLMHISVCRQPWSCDQNIFYKFWLTIRKESLYENSVQLAEWFLRKLCFNILLGHQYERLCLKGNRKTLTFGSYL